LQPATVEFAELEQVGLKEVGLCGFVLVAGGLGERLGYKGIKVALPVDTITRRSYLQHYCEQILSIQQRYAPEGHMVPLAIMVSEDTETLTKNLLEVHSYFGLQSTQVCSL
jgi:UDP-sugar pyrophosphorylase